MPLLCAGRAGGRYCSTVHSGLTPATEEAAAEVPPSGSAGTLDRSLEIAALNASNVALMRRAWQADRLAGTALLPYVVWTGFATALTVDRRPQWPEVQADVAQGANLWLDVT